MAGPNQQTHNVRSQLKKIRLLLVVIISCQLIAACGSWWLPRAHKIDIQQGNILPEEAVTSVTTGMSRLEVENLLGQPVADTGGSPDRWDYIYSINKAGDRPDARRLTVFFDGDRVVNIDKEGFDTAGQ